MSLLVVGDRRLVVRHVDAVEYGVSEPSRFFGFGSSSGGPWARIYHGGPRWDVDGRQSSFTAQGAEAEAAVAQAGTLPWIFLAAGGPVSSRLAINPANVALARRFPRGDGELAFADGNFISLDAAQYAAFVGQFDLLFEGTP